MQNRKSKEVSGYDEGLIRPRVFLHTKISPDNQQNFPYSLQIIIALRKAYFKTWQEKYVPTLHFPRLGLT
jgi:hypothetical protein